MRAQAVLDRDGNLAVQVVVEPSDMIPRGHLGNEIVSLGSEMVRLREQIVTLASKIKGKQIGKNTPDKQRVQRETDLKALAWAENRLAIVEGRRAGLQWVQQEVFGGP